MTDDSDLPERLNPFHTEPDWLLDSAFRVKLLIITLFIPIAVVMLLWAIGVLQ